MARQIRIVHARDFVSAKPDGRLDLEESKRLLLEVSGFLETCDASHILLDTRGSISVLSASDLWYLADCLAQQPKPAACRIAILCPAERFDYASFYALCAERLGIQMQAFLSYEEAMQWLNESAP